MILQLDHINMTVSDFKETVDWYERVFQFELVEQGVQSGQVWGVIKGGEAMLCIYEDPSRTNNSERKVGNEKFHGMNHFALRIEDKESWLEAIKRENIQIHYGGAISWPHSTSWYISDPSGYTIEVAYWHNSEIRFS